MGGEVQIILVEDNADDAALTIRAFKKYNVANELVHLKDGAEAVDFLLKGVSVNGKTLSQGNKVILLDLRMPKLNGIEVLQQIKADASTRDIPVLVLTSSSEDPDIKTCYDLGVNSYITKPVEFESFVKGAIRLGMNWTVRYQHAG